MKARDIMTTSPSVVTPEETAKHAAQIMRDLDVGFVPVVEKKSTMRVVGVLTDRDLVIRGVAEGHVPSETRVRDCMTRGPIASVGMDENLPQVIATMEEAEVRRVVVVDTAKRLVGVIAQADLATKVGPTEPHVVEHMLEKLSGHAMAGA